ncbi:hypothetical protein [Desulfobotulus sp.]|uniref:hypothetical protein n=1 Tax=Desulfobotulus sp. TaxID=1940337 RepID=UPI002A363CEF|nr:hypothetical protein [Desulfobotulus sp.]MDY0164628.1 hypothetical protein [Desulfobotulus sp.]
MTFEEIRSFAGSRFPEPFVMDGYMQATDGKILVRVPITNTLLALAGPNCGKHTATIGEWLWSGHHAVDWVDLPIIDMESLEPCGTCRGTLKVPAMDTCPECDGEGEIPSRAQVVDCTTCDSTGKKIDTENPVKIGEAHIQIRYLLKIAGLSGAKIAQVSRWYDPVPFVFDGGQGVVMPVKMGLRD